MPGGRPLNTGQIELRTQQLGRELWDRLGHHSPSIFERRWWDEQILQAAMHDDAVKVQMFRFVDVLPMLRDERSLTRHLKEYFGELQDRLPDPVRWALDLIHPETAARSAIGRLVSRIVRDQSLGMARRFIAGNDVASVFAAVTGLREQQLATTLDWLGEAIVSEEEADRYLDSYLQLMTGLGQSVRRWPEQPQLDSDDEGPLPKVNVSIKLSALYSQFQPNDPEGTIQAVLPRLRQLLRHAQQHDVYVHVDMEHYAFKDLTLAVFQRLLMEPEFRAVRNVGIVIQAYLPDAERDLRQMLDWVHQRGTPVWIRLVKGAYWDYEVVTARSRGWTIPVYQQKWQSDQNYERQSLFLLEHARWLKPAFASHNLRSLAHAMAAAEVMNLPQNSYEVQMLYGMGDDIARALAARGQRVRVYTPFGDLIPGMAYLVRRLLENTSNDSFLRASYGAGASPARLLSPPGPPQPGLHRATNLGIESARARTEEQPAGSSVSTVPQAHQTAPISTTAHREPGEMNVFHNEPLIDFGVEAQRQAQREALADVARRFPESIPLLVAGQSQTAGPTIESRNPSHPSQVVARAVAASVQQVEQAVQAAKQASPGWMRTPSGERIRLLRRVADLMQERRFELNAWIISETGKPWVEADADVAEAIDFLRYYALQMEQLARPRRLHLPGEEEEYLYRPRGVATVIAPWNFPLAILTGMTSAALVTGNTVLMKPAEQSIGVAWQLFQLFEAAGCPPNVLTLLNGVGEEIGPTLVAHRDVDLIAFTGSLAVGLEIQRLAAVPQPGRRQVKRVVAEMGGKNAIIVDDDANLDEAVLGVVHSAFGYAGQKCSACSRVIVLDSIHDEFVTRLSHAANSILVGPAEDPRSFLGPVIDAESKQRIERYLALGRQEARQVAGRDVTGVGDGYFVAPHLFADVDPHSRLAQEEIFGPVLAILRAGSFEQALELANDTDYALTGGVYSRSPVHLDLARQRFEVGNLYLNRPITGAMVERHPFGGYKLSGIGSKAGGPDYLQQFVIPINISENTLRRGFAPEADAGE